MIDDFDRAWAEEAADRLLREAEIWRLERALQENPEPVDTDPCDICHREIMPGEFYMFTAQGLVCCCYCRYPEDGDDISRMRVHRQADDTDDPDEEPPF